MRCSGPRVASAPLLAAVLVGIAACGASQSRGSIVVFAAASLKAAFGTLVDQFKADNPGAGVEVDYAGSSELATALTQGATADVFASADTAQMDAVAKAGLLAGDPTNFASNTLVIVTAPGNPKRVDSFAGLAKPGISVVVCQRPVPCGAATQRIEDTAHVRLTPVSEETDVSDVLDKVTTGQADAALVYVTDARRAGDKVATVTFPEAAGAVNVYPIGVLKQAPKPELARTFVALVNSDAGRTILAHAGFGAP
jgi:molybdate transport system substrate-binding protein